MKCYSIIYRLILTVTILSGISFGSLAAPRLQPTRTEPAKKIPMLTADAPKVGADATKETQWRRLGTGLFTEVMVSSIYYPQVKPVSIPAEVEQSLTDPNTYRIKAPYENWRDFRSEGIFTYDPEKATPMIIHIVDNKYAWFEEFDTGLYIDTEDAEGKIYGEIKLSHQAQHLIEGVGFDAVLSNLPGCLATYDKGTITLGAGCTLGGDYYFNASMEMTEPDWWPANRDGSFRIQLPFAENLDPQMQWTTLEGKALFSDDFTTLLTGPDLDPVYNEWEVEIQQNVANPDLYRLVNPYEGWEDPYKYYNVTYDNSTNHYINLYTFPKYGKAATDRFFTGFSVEGFGRFGMESTAYNFYFTEAQAFNYTFEDVAEEFPELFAEFKDGVITCPATFAADYYGSELDYPMYMAWMSSNPEGIYRLNEGGRFKVVFPEAREDNQDPGEDPGKDPEEDPGEGPGDDSGIGMTQIEEYSNVEYYTPQGVRLEHPKKGQLVIERRGDKTAKVIY